MSFAGSTAYNVYSKLLCYWLGKDVIIILTLANSKFVLV